ncbi:MAG: Cys-tRNA(Pro) deacylase [Victivallaceae bacterium]|nr:Cys-tRNA(Pro) deacylase [Victivallaceae bacterium]
MGVEKKTNAMRLLEAEGIAFEAFHYDTADGEIDVRSVARKIGRPIGQVFKTLVTVSPENELFVFVVSGENELDLKKAARAAKVKSIAMLHAKKLLPLTGYIHGGCSPVGMKKSYPTFIDENAVLYDRIFVSGGMVGLNLAVSPTALAEYLRADFADIGE